jgi:hypothetical protein
MTGCPVVKDARTAKGSPAAGGSMWNTARMLGVSSAVTEVPAEGVSPGQGSRRIADGAAAPADVENPLSNFCQRSNERDRDSAGRSGR